MQTEGKEFSNVCSVYQLRGSNSFPAYNSTVMLPNPCSLLTLSPVDGCVGSLAVLAILKRSGEYIVDTRAHFCWVCTWIGYLFTQ